MTEYLLFRLYGPMASWGDIAVGEVRPSLTHPTKSAMLGLVAAALGIDRADEAAQSALARGYGFAVLVESMGTSLIDYHTAQVPPAGGGKKKRLYPTRKDELETLARNDLSTILSRRTYRMDALATVILWVRNLQAPYTLNEIATALDHPQYVLSLGRKSCPLALPLEAQVVSASTIHEALAKKSFVTWEPLKCIRVAAAPRLFWEDGTDAGIKAQHTYERRDQPRSRRRWQFDVRNEHEGIPGDE